MKLFLTFGLLIGLTPAFSVCFAQMGNMMPPDMGMGMGGMNSVPQFMPDKPEFDESLFNVDNWVQHGGDATYWVEDGCIVGKRGDGPNSFLCTKKEYGDFILRFDCKFDIPINSGVQIRSQVCENGTVYGYQCEIDQNTSSSGAIYGESERGRWLDHFSAPGIVAEAAEKAFVKDEWNHFEIQCFGPTVRTWINGVPCANYWDTAYQKGVIGLQVHSSENDGQVRWKNIQIQEFPTNLDWESLFTHKDFSNLWVSPAGKWEMENDGTVHAISTSDQTQDGMLKTNARYTDFAAVVKFKQIRGNSGLYFRATEIDKPHWLGGFQNEIDGNATASLWEVGYSDDQAGRGWVANKSELADTVFKHDDWNELAIIAIGDRLVTILNGQEIVNIIDPECRKEGVLALQLHGNGDTEYYFKDWKVLPICFPQQQGFRGY